MTTAKDIIPLLRKRHQDTNWEAPRWVFFEELRVGTGFRLDKHDIKMGGDGRWQKVLKGGYHPEQRIDAWAMSTWKSDEFQSIAYEIKVSRADFLREIEHPEKRATAMAFSNRFFFVAPDGLIKPDEVPFECGLLVAKNDKVRAVKHALHRDIGQPSWEFYASLIRAIGRKRDEALFDELAGIEDQEVTA